MKNWKEMSAIARDARAGIVEQRTAPARSKRPRCVVVESRRNLPNAEWRKWRTYTTPEVAQQAADQQARKYRWREFRLQPQEAEGWDG